MENIHCFRSCFGMKMDEKEERNAQNASLTFFPTTLEKKATQNENK